MTIYVARRKTLTNNLHLCSCVYVYSRYIQVCIWMCINVYMLMCTHVDLYVCWCVSALMACECVSTCTVHTRVSVYRWICQCTYPCRVCVHIWGVRVHVWLRRWCLCQWTHVCVCEGFVCECNVVHRCACGVFFWVLLMFTPVGMNIHMLYIYYNIHKIYIFRYVIYRMRWPNW